jgi:hypothetical protein
MNTLEITRRHFFRQSGFGIAGAALAQLLGRELRADDTAARKPHFPARAKSVIYLFMAGGPSQLDLFDPKPRLSALNGTGCPEEMIKGERFAFVQGNPRLLGSPYAFRKHGRSGIEVSELLPHLSTVLDDLAVVRSVNTTQFNHAPAQLFMNTGDSGMQRPSLGSWLSYGIGSENENLPGFVVLASGQFNPEGGKSCWGNGFLPTVHQGVEFRSKGDPVLFLNNPAGVGADVRRDMLDAVRDLNLIRREREGNPEVSGRIASYEMAYRMQSSVPELMNIDAEPREVHEMYGTEPGKVSFANNCLLARRLVERGTRFIQLYHWGWDHHGSNTQNDLMSGLPRSCRETDRAIAALLKDLKRRGLLDSTLVVWGGEFGRTPMNEEYQGSKLLGRDHHAQAFTMWLAGGGVKAGITVGRTDELGYRAAEDPVSVHDLHATMLHLLGLDHTKLTYRHQGRDFRLTDVHGKVVEKLLA